jgi:hypothetical protein
LEYAVFLEFQNNMAQWFRENPQYDTTPVSKVRATLYHLLRAVPHLLDSQDVRMAAFKMLTRDIRRVIMHEHREICNHIYPSVPLLLDWADEAEKVVKCDVQIMGSTTPVNWNQSAPPVLLATHGAVPRALPAPPLLQAPPIPAPPLYQGAQIQQLPDTLFADMNVFLIHGIPAENVERPNPLGQVLVTLAMQDPDTALNPDPTVSSPIPIQQQQAVVFGVAADLAQQPCADGQAQLMEVLQWLQLVIQQALKDAPAFRKQLDQLAANRSKAWAADARSPMKCWNCGAEGHRQRDCPKPRRRNATDYTP